MTIKEYRSAVSALRAAMGQAEALEVFALSANGPAHSSSHATCSYNWPHGSPMTTRRIVQDRREQFLAAAGEIRAHALAVFGALMVNEHE